MDEKTTIKARVRPQKVAVLIPVEINEIDFRNTLEFLGWLWGGKYSCIIPFDTNEIELALSWLERYSPDLVLCANSEIVNALTNRLKELVNPPLQIIAMQFPLADNFRINRGELMPWSPAYDRYVKLVNSQPDITTRYCFTSTSDGIADRIFYDLSFGVNSKEHCEYYAKQLKAKSQHIDDGSISKFITLHNCKEHSFTHLDFSGIEIDTINSEGVAPTIFVLAPSVIDYAWFWNCRHDFSSGGNNCIPIPEYSIEDTSVIEAIASWLTGFHSGKANYCEIKSISVSKNSLEHMARRLRPRVKKHGINHVDVCCHSKHNIPAINIHHKQQDVTATWVNSDSFQFTPPKLSFAEEISKYSHGRWIVELDGGSMLKGHMPPFVAFRTNTLILNSPSTCSPTWSLGVLRRRYCAGNIIISCSEQGSLITLTLPTPDELLVPYFNSLGLGALPDEKRTCYETTISAFGDVTHLIACCKGPRHEILSALWSNREVPCEQNGHKYSKGCHVKQADAPTPVTFKMIRHARGIAKDWDKPFTKRSLSISDPLIEQTYEARIRRESGFFHRNDPSSFLKWLVENDIVRRVFRYPQCLTCLSNANWVTKVDLEQPLKCSRCGSHIAFHESQLDMEYQPNPLICRAFDEGIRPVALTLDVLRKASSGFMYLPGFKGKFHNKKLDIDIIAICDGHLVFCECKNMLGVPAQSKDWKKVQSQFAELIDNGERFGASSVVLASFADTYPIEIIELAKQRSSETMRVVLLHKDELLHGFVKITRDDGNNRNASLYEAFLPRRNNRKKKVRGTRIVSFGWGTIQAGGKCR